MPLYAVTAEEAVRKPTVIYNHPDGSGRTYGARVEAYAARPSTPSAATAVAAPTGGTLPVTTSFSYRWTTYTKGGGVESLPATGVLVATTAATSRVTVTIPPLVGSVANIYRSVTVGGPEVFLTSVSRDDTVNYVDTGAITPSGALPTGSLTAGTLVIRVPWFPNAGEHSPRGRTVVAEAATAIGQAGKYEYNRV